MQRPNRFFGEVDVDPKALDVPKLIDDDTPKDFKSYMMAAMKTIPNNHNKVTVPMSSTSQAGNIAKKKAGQ